MREAEGSSKYLQDFMTQNTRTLIFIAIKKDMKSCLETYCLMYRIV